MSPEDHRDELRQRFDRSRQEDAAPTTEPETEQETDDASQPSNSSKTDQTDESSQSERSLKEERKQVAMYLPEGLRQDLEQFYDELDARSKLAGQGELQKNRDFYEGVVKFILERRKDFAEYIDVEIEN